MHEGPEAESAMLDPDEARWLQRLAGATRAALEERRQLGDAGGVPLVGELEDFLERLVAKLQR